MIPRREHDAFLSSWPLLRSNRSRLDNDMSSNCFESEFPLTICFTAAAQIFSEIKIRAFHCSAYNQLMTSFVLKIKFKALWVVGWTSTVFPAPFSLHVIWDLTKFCETKSGHMPQAWWIRILEIGSGMGIRSNSGQGEFGREWKRFLIAPAESYVQLCLETHWPLELLSNMSHCIANFVVESVWIVFLWLKTKINS